MTTTYSICGREYDSRDEAERQINALFWDMLEDCAPDLRDLWPRDKPAIFEAFHNWKDGLNKDGLICEASCDDLCFEADQAPA